MPPKITAIGNRKGGVGKTSVTLGLATGLTLLKRRVLIVDLDPQANATDTLGGEGDFNIFDVLYAGQAGTLGQAVASTEWRDIDLVPGSGDLARIDTETLVGAEMRLRASIQGAEELEQYDHILIDLPPALGRLTLNGLIAADQVVVVTEPTSYSAKGVVEFRETIDQVRSTPYLNPSLQLAGIIINRLSSPMTTDHKYWLDQLESTFGDEIQRPYFTLRTVIQDSQSGGVPLTKMASRGASLMTEYFVEHARRVDGNL